MIGNWIPVVYNPLQYGFYNWNRAVGIHVGNPVLAVEEDILGELEEWRNDFQRTHGFEGSELSQVIKMTVTANVEAKNTSSMTSGVATEKATCLLMHTLTGMPEIAPQDFEPGQVIINNPVSLLLILSDIYRQREHLPVRPPSQREGLVEFRRCLDEIVRVRQNN